LLHPRDRRRGVRQGDRDGAAVVRWQRRRGAEVPADRPAVAAAAKARGPGARGVGGPRGGHRVVVHGGARARAGAVAGAAAVGQAAVVTHLHRQVPDSDAGGHGRLWLGGAEHLERREGGGGVLNLLISGAAADAGTNTSATFLLVCGGGGGGGRVLVVLEMVHCPL